MNKNDRMVLIVWIRDEAFFLMSWLLDISEHTLNVEMKLEASLQSNDGWKVL